MKKQSIEQRLFEIESELNSLKAVYAISGSLVEFKVLKSSNYTKSTTDARIKAKLTFKPTRKLEQNVLTRLFLVIADVYIVEGEQVIGPTQLFMDKGLWDSNGNLYIEETYVGQSFIGDHNFTIYGIASGPADGSFECEITVVT